MEALPESAQQMLDEATYLICQPCYKDKHKKSKIHDQNVTTDNELTLYCLPLEQVDSFLYLDIRWI